MNTSVFALFLMCQCYCRGRLVELITQEFHHLVLPFFASIPLVSQVAWRSSYVSMKKIKQNEATKVIVALEDRTPDLVSNSKDQQVGKFEEPQNMIEAIRYTLLEKKHIGRIL